MTWKELMVKINKMPEAEQNLPVRIWGEEQPLRDGSFERTPDEMYWNPDWEGCFMGSDLDDDDITHPDTVKILGSGVAYLWAE